MRRWPRRLLLILALTLIASVFAAQLLLWSDLPRRLVLDTLERRLGLQVHATRLRVSWWGRMRVENLSIVVPLTGEELAAAPVLTVRHTNLPWLLLWRQPRVHAVWADHPRLRLTQSSAGSWNVRALIPPTTEPPDAQAARRRRPPRLHVRGATVTVTDRSGRTGVLRGVDVTAGAGVGPTWPLEIRAAVPDISISGRMASTDDLAHEIDFDLRADAAQLPWLALPRTQTVSARGQWRGRITADGPAGQMDLHEAALAGTVLTGTVMLHTFDGGLRIQPRGLEARRESDGAAMVRLSGGEARMAASLVTLDELQIEALEGLLRLSGQIDPAATTGQVQAAWSDMRAGPVRHGGSVTLRLQSPHPRRLTLSGEFNTRCTGPLGDWEAAGRAQAVGAEWKRLRAHLRTDVLRMRADGLTESMGEVSLLARLDWPTVTVQSIRAPQPARVDFKASANLTAGQWELEAQGRQLRLAGLPELDIELGLRGDPRIIDLHTAKVRASQWLAVGAAAYDLDGRHLTTARAIVQPAPGSTLARLVDDAVAHFDARGAVSPLDLQLTAAVAARAFTTAKQRSVAGVEHVLTGRLTRQSLDLDVEDLPLLGGVWQGRMRYLLDDGRADMALTSRGLDMGQVGRLLSLPAMSGEADLRITAHLSELNVQGVDIEAQADLRDVSIGPLRASRGRAQAALRNADLRVHLMDLESDDGRAEADLRANVLQPAKLTVAMHARKWPLDWETAGGLVVRQFNCEAQWEVDIKSRGARGPVHLSGDLEMAKQPLAEVRLEGSMADRVLELHRFEADVLDGRVAAQGRIDLDNWRRSLVAAECRSLDLAVLSRLRPSTHTWRGTVDGSLVMEPSTDPRALEPHRVTASLAPANEAAYGPIALGPVHLNGYLGPRRLIVSDGGGEVAGGTMALRGRISEREAFRSYDVRVTMEDLDLEPLAAVLGGGARLGQGRLGGELHLIIQGDDPATLGGRGEVTIRQSSMLNNSVFGAIYGAMRLGVVGGEPSGEGEMRVRLEGGTLVIENLRYFSQGTDIRIYGQVGDVWQGARAPLNLYALAAMRPLADIPLAQIIDQAMQAFAAGATTLHVTGTVEDPRAEPVTLSALRQGVRAFLRPLTGR